ncbi:MAG: nucleotide pyrophosphohydrolase [Anaerolineaceae bacterium]
MNLDELTQKMHALVESKGWYAADSVKQQTPRNLAISLVLEAAEVLELFQWQSDCQNQEALAGELADTTLYLLQLASVSGIDLEQAVLTKIAQNQARLWPEHLSKEQDA